MDEDFLHHALPSEPMPPENKVSCALESVDVMRRLVALFMGRLGINKLNVTKFELDNSPVETLLVNRDKHGNVNLSLES